MGFYIGGIFILPSSARANKRVGRNHNKNRPLSIQTDAQKAAQLLRRFPRPKQMDIMSAKLDMLAAKHEDLTKQYNLYEVEMSSLMSGDITIDITPASPLSVTATTLNAAAAGSHKIIIVATCKDSNGSVLRSLKGSLATSISKSVTPPVGDPTINVLREKDAVTMLQIVMDTDAGSTKVYSAGDSVTVDVKVASDDKLLGITITPAQYVINVT